MAGKLSTHVLDTARGCPARDMKIELWLLSGETPTLLRTVRANVDGRTDSPLLSGTDLKAGEYEPTRIITFPCSAHPGVIPRIEGADSEHD